MKIAASGAILLLTFSILSFGMPNLANAQSTEPPLSVETDYSVYAENSDIVVSGIVKESSLADYNQPITIRILNPDGNIVTIDQKNLDSNNSYKSTFVTGGPLWKSGGEYVILVQYGPQKAETTITLSLIHI